MANTSPKTHSRSSRRGHGVVLLLLTLLVPEIIDAGRRAARAAPSDPDDSLAYVPQAGYEAPTRSPGRLAPAHGALIGSHSDDSVSGGVEDQHIVQLEEAIGRTLDINNKYYGEFDEIAREGISWVDQWDIENGRIPLIGWACGYSDRINSGAEDAVIRKTAQVMRDFGHEFFMRYCWEMDGERPEKRKLVKKPEDFIAAWRRMHRIFTEERATNVVWVWTGNAAGFTKKDKYTGNTPPAPHYYPGDDVVDWISSDGYNWGVSNRDQGDKWRHFPQIFDAFMVFARQHPKPIMIAEHAAQEQQPGDKADWMGVAYQCVMDVPRTDACPWCGMFKDIAAMIYFDVEYKHGDWRIMSSPDSTAVYKEAANDPWFKQVQTLGLPYTHDKKAA